MPRKLSDIDKNSERGLAYEKAKQRPGTSVKFQAESGFATVRYSPGFDQIEVRGIVIVAGHVGHWYEAPVVDLTAMETQTSLGSRIYDEKDAA